MAVIPTKNSASLIGYYLGVVSLIPIFGLVTALPAVICGAVGVRKAITCPEAEGMGHAITAIALGIVGPVGWVGLTFLLFSL